LKQRISIYCQGLCHSRKKPKTLSGIETLL